METSIITKKLADKTSSFNDIKGQLIIELTPYIMELTGRRPLILPVILDVKKEVKEHIS